MYVMYVMYVMYAIAIHINIQLTFMLTYNSPVPSMFIMFS